MEIAKLEKVSKFDYKVEISDKYILETVQSVIFGNKVKVENLQNTIESIVEKFDLSSDNIQLELFCEAKELNNIIEDYQLDRDRILNEKLTRNSKAPKRKPSIPLIPYKYLLEVEDIHAEFDNLLENSLYKEITNKVTLEYFTNKGNGVSAQTVKAAVADLNHATSDLRRHKDSLRELDKAIEEGQVILDKAEEYQSEINKLEAKKKALEEEVKLLNQQKTEAFWKNQKSDKSVGTDQISGSAYLKSPKSEMTTSGTFAIKTTLDPPVWERGRNKSDRISVMEYIRSLKNFFNLGIMTNEKQLIFSSLSKSNLLSIYEELSSTEKDSLGEFCKYLQKTYGGSANQIRQELFDTKQAARETYNSFFRRIIGMYQRSRNEDESPDIANITDKAQISDITYHFLNGLRSPRVKMLLQTNANSIKFADLGSQAQDYAEIVEDDKIPNMNVVDTTNNNGDLTSTVDCLVNAMMRMQRNCWTCGYPGHTSYECRASPKTRALNNKARRRSEERRSRSRDRRSSRDGRGRSYSRERDSYKRRSRSQSYDRHSYSNRNNDRRRLSQSRQRSRSYERRNDRGNRASRERSYERTRSASRGKPTSRGDSNKMQLRSSTPHRPNQDHYQTYSEGD